MDRPRRLIGNINLALLQTRKQLVGRQVDHFDLGGFIDHAVWYRLADNDSRHLCHDVVQAFKVLDVERGVHVNARRENLLHILITFGMA